MILCVHNQSLKQEAKDLIVNIIYLVSFNYIYKGRWHTSSIDWALNQQLDDILKHETELDLNSLKSHSCKELQKDTSQA